MFGQLPSYILANGTLYDMIVADALADYEKRVLEGKGKATPKVNKEKMMDMMKIAREQNAKRRKETEHSKSKSK